MFFSYFLASFRPDDSGNYTCVVSNEWASLSQSLDVKVLPRVVAQKPLLKDSLPGNHSVVRGHSVELQCQVVVLDAATPPAITW